MLVLLPLSLLSTLNPSVWPILRYPTMCPPSRLPGPRRLKQQSFREATTLLNEDLPSVLAVQRSPPHTPSFSTSDRKLTLPIGSISVNSAETRLDQGLHSRDIPSGQVFRFTSSVSEHTHKARARAKEIDKTRKQGCAQGPRLEKARADLQGLLVL